MVSQRLRRLAVLEFVNVIWLPLVCYVWIAPLSTANIAGTIPALVLLLEGSAYWWFRLRRLQGQAVSESRWFSAFATLKICNVVMLAVTLPIVGYGLATAPLSHALPGLVFWILGALEQVNYFSWQLMYDNRADLKWLFTRGLKRAHLARDLDAWRRRRDRAKSDGRPAPASP